MSLCVGDRFVCRSERQGLFDLHTKQSHTHNDIYQMLYWYNWFSWWWARGCSKHVENWNKYIEKNRASSWPFTNKLQLVRKLTLSKPRQGGRYGPKTGRTPIEGESSKLDSSAQISQFVRTRQPRGAIKQHYSLLIIKNRYAKPSYVTTYSVVCAF